MTLRSHVRYGKRRASPPLARLRLCPICDQLKPLVEFQPRKKARALNVYCNWCGRDKGAVQRFFQLPRSPLEVHALAIKSFLRERARRRTLKGKEVGLMSRPEEYMAKVSKLPDRVAAIVGKTFAAKGDSAELADDQALMMIRDLVEEIDGGIITRNANKRLSRLPTR